MCGGGNSKNILFGVYCYFHHLIVIYSLPFATEYRRTLHFLFPECCRRSPIFILFIHHKLSTFFPVVAAFYTPFFKEVWEKKPEIEQAFHMEEPISFNISGESTLEMPPRQPRPPPRHESYHIKAGSNDG
jgi:hypothetical protein